MSYRNTIESYGSVTKFFHWTIAILVVIMLIVGLLMGELPNGSFKGQVYNIHKLNGLLLLTLVIARLLWTLTNPKPQLPASTPVWQGFIARTVHWLFYIALIAMPMSGWVMSTAAGRPPALFGWEIALPGIAQSKELASTVSEVHEFWMWVLWGLLTLHVLAALKHHFINKDNVLRRMLPGSKNLSN